VAIEGLAPIQTKHCPATPRKFSAKACVVELVVVELGVRQPAVDRGPRRLLDVKAPEVVQEIHKSGYFIVPPSPKHINISHHRLGDVLLSGSN
jgi:hypothetical protein